MQAWDKSSNSHVFNQWKQLYLFNHYKLLYLCMFYIHYSWKINWIHQLMLRCCNHQLIWLWRTLSESEGTREISLFLMSWVRLFSLSYFEIWLCYEVKRNLQVPCGRLRNVTERAFCSYVIFTFYHPLHDKNFWHFSPQ